jgi:hypothetical protein
MTDPKASGPEPEEDQDQDHQEERPRKARGGFGIRGGEDWTEWVDRDLEAMDVGDLRAAEVERIYRRQDDSPPGALR